MKTFNDRTKMAEQIVVDVLVRSATAHAGAEDRSIVSPMVHKRLMELAMTESAELTKRALDERNRCRANLAAFRAGLGPRRKKRTA